MYPKIVAVLTLLSVLQRTSSPEDQTNMSAEPGDEVTLTCELPNNDPVTVLEWSRADLTQYVLMYRDKQLDPEDPYPSYVNRVDLKDRRLKDGDASLVLKNVTTDDDGRYECRIFQRRRNHLKRDILKMEPICVVNLSVVPPARPGGREREGNSWAYGGVVAGLTVCGLILLIVIVVISKQRKKMKSLLCPPPDEATDEASDEELL